MIKRIRPSSTKFLFNKLHFSKMSTSLVIAEHDGINISPGTLSTITAAKKIGSDVSLLVLGHSLDKVSSSASKINGIKKVLLFEQETLKNGVAEDITQVIHSVSKDFSHILGIYRLFTYLINVDIHHKLYLKI